MAWSSSRRTTNSVDDLDGGIRRYPVWQLRPPHPSHKSAASPAWRYSTDPIRRSADFSASMSVPGPVMMPTVLEDGTLTWREFKNEESPVTKPKHDQSPESQKREPSEDVKRANEGKHCVECGHDGCSGHPKRPE